MTNFKIHGTYCTSLWHAYVIEISNDGSAARVADSCTGSNALTHVGKWQEIKYTKRNSEPYIIHLGRRLKLDNFIRV